MRLSTLVDLAIKCKRGFGGNTSEIQEDGRIKIYTAGGYYILTNGKSVCNVANHSLFKVYRDKECDISELLKQEEERNRRLDNVTQNNLTLSQHIIDKGKLTKRPKSDLKKYADYMAWIEQNKKK